MSEVKLTKSLGEWQEIHAGIQELMQEAIPFKEAYWVARSADSIESAIKNLETIRKKMLDEMCDKDEEGKPIMASTPQGMQYELGANALKFQVEWAGVMEQPVEISIFTVSMEKLGEKMETIKPAILKGAMAILAE